MKKIILKADREKSLLRRHPWVFSGALKEVQGTLMPGEVVPIYSASGEFLAQGAYSPTSAIRLRIWSYQEQVVVDAKFLEARIQQAVQRRISAPWYATTTARRLVHGESDYLPGLIVDQYNDVLVVQFLSWSVEAWREEITHILAHLPGVNAVYERSDVDVRELEGLSERTGSLTATSVPHTITIDENHLRFHVNVQTGQKTGFYLDQRNNRALTQKLASGRRILNCFCYTGGFTLAALAGGAKEVVSIDSSGEALHTAQENLALNHLDKAAALWIEGDVFRELRKMRDSRESFDLIVLDPPKFAPTASQAAAAARGYKDINLLALKLLNPGGLLFTFSCSGGITPELFQKIVADAAVDAKTDAHILHKLSAAEDHPIALSFPEGEYLKGLVIQKAG